MQNMRTETVRGSGNPSLTQSTFAPGRYTVVSGARVMTLEGTVHRTFFLLCLLVASATITWGLLATDPARGMALTWGGLFGAFMVALVTVFKKEWSPYSAPVYAVLQGLFLGGVSAIYEAAFEGIVLQAVVLTFGTLFSLLAAYRSGLIKATENFKLGVVAATGGICLVYLFSMVAGLLGRPVPMIHEAGSIGIGFSVFVVIIAALNLVLDFDFIEAGCENRLPQFMEWYAAFGLMVTLIWLYLEILRLLAKSRSSR